MRLMNKFFKSHFVDSDSNGISYTLLDQAEADGCHLNVDEEDLFPDRSSGTSRSHFIPISVSIFFVFVFSFKITWFVCRTAHVMVALNLQIDLISDRTYVDYSNYWVWLVFWPLKFIQLTAYTHRLTCL